MFANQDTSRKSHTATSLIYFKMNSDLFVVDEENNIILKLKDNTKVTYKLKTFLHSTKYARINEAHTQNNYFYAYKPITSRLWWSLPALVIVIII